MTFTFGAELWITKEWERRPATYCFGAAGLECKNSIRAWLQNAGGLGTVLPERQLCTETGIRNTFRCCLGEVRDGSVLFSYLEGECEQNLPWFMASTV